MVERTTFRTFKSIESRLERQVVNKESLIEVQVLTNIWQASKNLGNQNKKTQQLYTPTAV